MLLCLFAAVVQAETGWQDNRSEQQRLEALKKKIAAIEERMRGNETRLGREQRTLAEVERQLQQTRKQERRLQADTAAIEDELLRLQGAQSETLARIQQQQELLALQARSSWSMGREHGLKLLLNAESPQQLQRMTAYYQYFARARGAAIEESRASMLELASLEQTIRSRNQTLLAKKSELKENAARLQQQRSEHGRALARLEESLRSDQKQLASMQRDREQLDALLQELREAVADINLAEADEPFASRRQKLPWPSDGRVRLAFGRNIAQGVESTGIIIESVLNSPVKAVHHGRVVFADRMSGFGQVIVVDHGEGYMSLYGYNEALTRDVGDWVAPGDTLALSGRSSAASQPVTYFEIRHRGKPENPVRWLKKRS